MKRAYLLTEAQVSILRFAATKIINEDAQGDAYRLCSQAVLEAARTALTQPLHDIVPQAEHEHARRYAK